jgi:hypothetical protein
MYIERGKRNKKLSLTNGEMRQGTFIRAPRPVDKFVKEFLSKHQEVFQKVLHLFKKVLSSIYRIIFRHFYRKKKNVSQPFVILVQLLYICTH